MPFYRLYHLGTKRHYKPLIYAFSFPFSSSLSSSGMKDRQRRCSLSWSKFFKFTFLFFFCLVFIFFFSHFRLLIGSPSFRPVLVAKRPLPTFNAIFKDNFLRELGPKSEIRIQSIVHLPDQSLVLINKLSAPYPPDKSELQCIYTSPDEAVPLKLPVMAVDEEEDFNFHIIRCPFPPEGSNSSLSRVPISKVERGGAADRIFEGERPIKAYNWDSLVYEALLDGDTTLVFVKGLNLRPERLSDPSRFTCVFGYDFSNPKLLLRTKVLSAAQEIIRCKTPLSLLRNPEKLESIKVSIEIRSLRSRVSSTHTTTILPSFANIKHISGIDSFSGNGGENGLNSLWGSTERLGKSFTEKREDSWMENGVDYRYKGRKFGEKGAKRVKMVRGLTERKPKYSVCMCTMMWNQAQFIKEWVMYHTRIGVERFFIYDNNSDDNLDAVVRALRAHNVSRRAWPWVKTQEAGFAHCALKARFLCSWLAFLDVDEFLFLKNPNITKTTNPNTTKPKNRNINTDIEASKPMQSILVSRAPNVGEVRIPCHSFGPSGHVQAPSHGVTVSYTCRLGAPERHKSVIRPRAVNQSMINIVHHFHLGLAFRFEDMGRGEGVVNHYKYQAWDVFQRKFYRRVATYVPDWGEKEGVGSRDRAPGLGTTPEEPKGWANKFCEVRDTGLREWVKREMRDQRTGRLPWEEDEEKFLER
ncbi:glycosyltransferase family 92 protein RCOM_0530710 [Amborella trichopoda]|nr:glycosyltransferase family 92 protein RCOM_0530710 [Amborella trichopoda]|eukprot:XP_020527574.1 glycosyltransferase family 92 protein RCOM_0530710 [Amborella trichopoda]